MSMPGIDVVDKARLVEYLSARYKHANHVKETSDPRGAALTIALGEMMAIADLCHNFDLVATVEDLLK